MQFQKISILPPWKIFVLHTPSPPGNFSLASYFASKILTFKTPLPLGISADFHGVGMDFFWNCTLLEAKHRLRDGRLINISLSNSLGCKILEQRSCEGKMMIMMILFTLSALNYKETPHYYPQVRELFTDASLCVHNFKLYVTAVIYIYLGVISLHIKMCCNVHKVQAFYCFFFFSGHHFYRC